MIARRPLRGAHIIVALHTNGKYRSGKSVHGPSESAARP